MAIQLEGNDQFEQQDARGSQILTPVAFECLAIKVLSQYFGVAFDHRSFPGIPADFDLVSDDCSLVGDVKYLNLDSSKRISPDQFADVFEHACFLDQIAAKRKFMIFGNPEGIIPSELLDHFRRIMQNVEFFFLFNDGKLEALNYSS